MCYSQIKREDMDYAKYFKKGGWTAMGAYYLKNPSKLKDLLKKVMSYANRDGLKKVKDELLFICQYVTDVFTGRYKEYNTLNLVVIIGAIVYVASPIDAVPDFIPAGFIDDTAVLLWALKEFADELERYRIFKGKGKAVSGESTSAASENTSITVRDIEDADFMEIK